MKGRAVDMALQDCCEKGVAAQVRTDINSADGSPCFRHGATGKEGCRRGKLPRVPPHFALTENQ